VWLQRNGERLSTLDLFGRHFVVLAGPDATSWQEAAAAVAERGGPPLEVHRIGADGLEEPDGTFCAASGLSPRGAMLVRPDGFVAWRSKTPAGSPSALGAALAQLLGRTSIVS
jgi:hypothetical protein